MAFGDGPANEGGMNSTSPTSSGYDPTVDPPVDPSAETESPTSVDHPLNERQTALYEAVECVVEQFGQFDQDARANGAHYMPESPFVAEGLACANCAFYDGARACEVVRGDIDPAGVCKLWIIPADLIVRSTVPNASTRSDASYIVRTWDSPEAAELRSAEDGRDIMTGHFAVFNTWTEINSRHEGQFMERIDPKAFNDTLAKRAKSIRVLYDHGADPQIGNKPLGEPLVMRADPTGVYYEVALFDAPYVNDLKPALRSGQLGASFRMKVTRDEWNNPTRSSSDNPNLLPERTITGIELYEFGPVTFPAYAEATAGLRSRTDWFCDELLNDPIFIARFVERIGAANFEAIRNSLPAGAAPATTPTIERGAAGETVTTYPDRKRLVAARYR